MGRVSLCLVIMFFICSAQKIDAQVQNIREKQDTISATKSLEHIRPENIKKGPLNNALDVLSGQSAGVNVTTNGTDRLAMLNSIRVRGTTSIMGGNDPLVIIDGVTSDIATLSTIYPADIESFTILKNATETAMYGSRGASGVIEIKTKKGTGRGFEISYDGNYGFESMYKHLQMLNGPEYIATAEALGLASEYKVLIVDDVPTNVMLVQAILKKEGYTLLTCDSGTKALRIANEKHPNLILLDIMMPEMDGYEVLQHLKSNPETTDIPVIIMSALSDMQSIVKGYQLGATEYVTKPFQREELVKRVAHRYELYSIKRIKAELENTIESRDTLYSVIAHDLRSPLGSLKMMNNAILMMVDKERVGDEVYEMIQMMNKTSEEIFLLLDNLLKWAKNRLNKQHVYKQQTDINSIIDSTAEMYVPMAAQKGVKIILENLDKELVGLVDIDMLKTIIRNLISNAMKFSFEGGTITLSSRSEGDFVTVSVKDTGKGIKKEDQDKLLKQDSHFTTYGTKNEKGSGLGLMLCKDFVELHGGKLWFESEGEGKGTTFLFSMKALNQEA